MPKFTKRFILEVSNTADMKSEQFEAWAKSRAQDAEAWLNDLGQFSWSLSEENATPTVFVTNPEIRRDR